MADTIRREDWNRCGGMPNMHGRNGVLDQFLCVWRAAATGTVEENAARVVTLQTAAAIRQEHQVVRVASRQSTREHAKRPND